MTTRKAQIDATMDASGVVVGADVAKKSLKGLAESAKESGRDIGGSLDDAGKKTGAAAAKIEADTKRAADSIQRTIAQLEASGKGKAAYFEQLFSMRGVDTNALRPLLDQLAEVEARQKKATIAATGFAGGTDAAAKSAAQLSYQLRQVGPQFTDIVTSLASGQAPLTVLIQQGGQLKDVFGGIGPAARALGGYLLSLINPYTVAAAAIAAIGYAYNRGAQEEKEFTKAILLSGNAAGVTSNQLAGMASSLKNITGSQGAAADALALFVRAGDVGSKNLEKFAASALLFEKTTGQAVSETVKQFEALKKAPLEASVKLNEATGYLTESVYRQIKALEEQGKKAEAAAVAQTALADANDKISRTMIDNAGAIERAWDAVVKVIKKVGSAILDIGRPEAATEVAKRLEAQIKQIENAGGGKDGKAGAFGAFQGDARQLNALREQLDNVRQIAAAEALGAKAQAEAVERSKLRIKFEEDLAKNAEKRKKADIEIAEVIALQTRNIITQAEATTRIGQIREKYKESAGPKDNSAARDAEAQRRAIAEALGVSADYVETLGRLERARANETLTVEAYTKAILDLIAKQSSSKEIAKAQEEAQKALEKAQKERLETAKKINAIEAQALNTGQQTIASLEAEVAQQRRANEEIGLSARALEYLRTARMDDTIAQAESTLVAAKSNDIGADRIAQMERELDLLRERRSLVSAGNSSRGVLDAEKAMKDAAQSAASEWQKASDQISQSLSDSLFRAAEAGKGFFQTLRDSIKGMFNSMILRPIIQAGFSGAVGAVGGALGLASPASAAASGLNGLGTLGSLSSLFGAGQGIGGAATSFATSGLGSLLGLSETVGGVGVGLTGAGSGLVSALTAIPVWGWAAMAAVAVAAIFGGDRGGPKGGGSFSTTGERLFTPNTADAQLDKLGGTLSTSITGALSKFGGNAAGLQFGLGFDTDPQGTANNRISSFLRDASGRTVLDNISGRDVGRDDVVLQTELTTETKRLMLAALQASDLQNGFSEIFKRLNPAEAAPEAIDALLALAEQLKALGDAADRLPGVMSSIADLSATAREELIGLAGGIDALTGNLQSYYENFFTTEEQLANAGNNLATDFAKIGLSFDALTADSDGPRRAFRDLVEGLDITTEAGRQSFAALIALNPALDAWIEGTEAATKAAQDASDALEALAAAEAKAARDAEIAAQKRALESSRSALADEMAALTNANGDLTRSLFELENPIQTTADRFLSLGETMQGMLDRMAEILGTGAVSLLDQLQAAVSARTGIANARSGVAGSIQGLQIQGFQNRGDLSGGISFLRNLERAAFAELATTSDPAGVAGKITNLITQRYQLEAQLISGAGDARQTSLRDEIATLEQMASIADQLKSTILDLQTGSLSALAPQDQVAVASAAYGDTLSRARAGDVKALQALPGAATQFLTEQQSFDASGGSYGATFTGVLADLQSVGASLSGVPTQLSLAQAQLTETGLVVDNTGAMAVICAAGHGAEARSTRESDAITALVTAIRAQVRRWTKSARDCDRAGPRGESLVWACDHA
jgi:phage-related minor tail protein